MTTSVAPPSVHLPVPKQVRDLLAGLLDREVTLETSVPLVPSAQDPRSVAVYVDDVGAVRAVGVCDLAFSARAGAALALLAPAAAQRAIDDGGLDTAMAENLYEVLNVAAAMFNLPGAVHLRLSELHAAGSAIPPHLVPRMLQLGRREDLAVQLAGYGPGRLSLVVCG